jgi:transcriptional antiterminator RfaH
MPILPAEPDIYPDDLLDGVAGPSSEGRLWYCLHTRPRQEKAIARDLRAGRVPFYLPQVVQEGRTPAGRKTSSLLPLFGGYLFLFGDEQERVRALKGDRIVNILEVADQADLADELRQIHRILRSGLPVRTEPSVPVGGRIRIASGPLAGLVILGIIRPYREGS